MNTQTWYQNLLKPSWAPPAWLFGPVWTVLYLIIVISFGYAAFLFAKGRISFLILLPFILNLIFNFAFSPIQFGLRNNLLAAADVILVLATLVWAMIAIWPHARWIALANTPYLLWVCFATVLQLTVTWLNWK
jgi:translocator protein